jgi:hypothetical protein
MTTNRAQMKSEELKASFRPIILPVSPAPVFGDSLLGTETPYESLSSAFSLYFLVDIMETNQDKSSPPTRRPTAEESDTANNCVTPLPSNSIRIAG